jgi:beta-N-acetylhexosaminidase
MKYAKKTRIFLIALITFLLIPLTIGQAAPIQQSDSPFDRAQALLDRLTPEERVGQLFLVTFEGPEAGAGSATGNLIFDLIVNNHIGGVVLRAENDNFVGYDQTIDVTLSLIEQLQMNEYGASQEEQINPETGDVYNPAYIPLLISIAQDGDGYPYDQLFSGLTPLPSQMAQGATWQPELAMQIGTILGQELSSLGFNMLLGPSLDVLEAPFSESGGDLGIRVFGGDPFWVGEMGSAYISGIHEGSNGKIAVVAKHFPGFGGSDRLPEEEVATVRKSLEQLKQIELAPFFAVTGNASSPMSMTDALLTSHIRYQGFQGNIRATTKPVSFDPQAFSQLMDLPEFALWRENGGVMISDDLGSRAVRRFYDPTGETFNGQFVARDAFLAGNDLLYLGNFVSSGDPDSYTTILRTLDFFTLKYREDSAFAQRVDESVLRILSLKFKLYGNTFTLNQTLPSPNARNEIGLSEETTFEIAREAATLISPSLDELDNTIPEPPNRNDQIVFISDTRIYQQCTNCRQEYTLDVNAFADAVIRFYSGSGEVRPGNLKSYTFEELQEMLDAGTGILQIENDLRNASWIVFSMTDVTPTVPFSFALRNFLNERPGLYLDKNLIVFSLNAPYYLDATDISKLTAYYGLYSRSDKFIEVAARLLFQEIQPSGNLPVSVSGVGYDLNLVTFPNPDQIIPLLIDIQGTEDSAEIPTPESTPTPLPLRISDMIPVRTGTILDHNGHPVPDGTIVNFSITYNGDSLPTQQISSQTFQGIARTNIRVDNSGTMIIRAESEPAKISDVLQFDIPADNITATEQLPTDTPTPTATGTKTPSPTTAITQTPKPTPQSPIAPTNPETGIGDWVISLLVASSVAIINYLLVYIIGGVRWAVRGGFFALIGGLLTYSYLALGLPGSSTLIQNAQIWGIIIVAFLGSITGASIVWFWRLVNKSSFAER